MNQYFPSKYSKGRCCERDYMWNIANTLHGITVKGLVEHALKQRFDVGSEKMKDETILMNDHWKEELKSLPIVGHVSIIITVITFCLEKRTDDIIA